MTDATNGEAVSTFGIGTKTALADPYSADASSELEIEAVEGASISSGQFSDEITCSDQDDYIVSYCICLHEPSSARREIAP